jgi:hypothetical protein
MLGCSPAVAQDVGIGATDALQHRPEFWDTLELPLSVDAVEKRDQLR